MYLDDTGEAVYKMHRLHSCRAFKHLGCGEFINYAVYKIKHDSWPPDACVGYAIASVKFQRSQIVCTKTLYNYIDLSLLAIKNINLAIKLRRSTKTATIKKHKKAWHKYF